MTNRQAQLGKFAPNRSEQPKFNPNWWRDLPKVHPLHDARPTRQQRRAAARMAILVPIPPTIDIRKPNRKAQRTQASIMRKAINAAKKGNRK